MNIRKLVAAGFAAALVAAGAVALAPVAHAGLLPSPVDPSIADGDTDSLRDVLENQVVDGDTVTLQAGATYVLDDCSGSGYIVIEAAITILGNGATIEQFCSDARVLDVKDAVTIDATTITGGDLPGDDGGGIYVDAEDEGDIGSLVLTNSTVTGNDAQNGGGLAGTGPITVVDSSVSGNNVSGDGGAIHNEAPLSVVRSTISGNCAEDDGGAIDADADTLLVNSTVSGNVFDDQGAVASDEGNLTIVYSTIVSNTLEDDVDCGVVNEMAVDEVEPADTDEPSNISVFGGELRIFGTVVALPIDVNQGSPGAFNCGLFEGGVTVSSGHNYSDDDTCGLTDATDVEDGADPQLGALAANGGPTLTHLPALTSPLVDAIPTDACGGGDALAGDAVTTDQRSLVRPDVLNETCDIGSVELQTELPVVLQPTFTG